MVSWITVLNYLLLLVILATSLSVPGFQKQDAEFVGEADDSERKFQGKTCKKHGN